MITKARSLQLFFVDGRPDGMLTAEVFNWTGHVLRIPRTQLREGLARKEASYTGVYLLLGEKESQPLAYIGETEELGARLRGHAKQKDWWETAVLITTAANNLHKAHVKYLESRLVEIAYGIRAIELENGNIPPKSSLSEADQANMESFLDTLQMVLPAIRVDMFMDKSRPSSAGPESLSVLQPENMVFVMKTPKHGVEGRAVLQGGEWIVQAGSKARAVWAGNEQSKTHYHTLHAELLANGTLRVEGKHAVFQTDYAFSSPSAAAAILNGRSSNGRLDWKTETDGRTYAKWEVDQLPELELDV